MKKLTPQNGFLGLGPDDAHGGPEKPGATIIPFGLEQTVSYGTGTANGPKAIIEASHQVELFDEAVWSEPSSAFHLETLAPFPVQQTVGAALDQLEGIVENLLVEERFPLTLGGEHSLTVGALRPFLRRHENLVILRIDAHADLRDGYDGEPFSHAATMRRCLDHPNLSLIGVGIRNISAEEISFFDANRKRIHLHWAKNRTAWNLAEIMTPLEGKPVYLSIDLDGFDSSLMPATGTPEPGGLFWDDVIAILDAAASASRELVGADIVELAPLEGWHACDFLAAKLAYKILSLKFQS